MKQQKKKGQRDDQRRSKKTPGEQRRSTYRSNGDDGKYPQKRFTSQRDQTMIQNTSTVQRLKRRYQNAGDDYDIDFKSGYNRNNETNPHMSDRERHRHQKYYGDPLSPNSKLILQSESQFMDNYGRKTEREIGRQTHYSTRSAGEDSMWDRLTRIFTFGCMETSHNQAKN